MVSAEYAFVLHTANPITGAKGEVFGELVQGMGEALVGNHPGRALSFKSAADSSQGVEVCFRYLVPYQLVILLLLTLQLRIACAVQFNQIAICWH